MHLFSRQQVGGILLLLASISVLGIPKKKFHCFPAICKFMHCEIPRECEYPHSYMKRKGGLCNCCDECIVIRFEGEPCNALIDKMYEPKFSCAPGLRCDDYTLRCVNVSKLTEPPWLL